MSKGCLTMAQELYHQDVCEALIKNGAFADNANVSLFFPERERTTLVNCNKYLLRYL